jgi:hypothetical protein
MTVRGTEDCGEGEKVARGRRGIVRAGWPCVRKGFVVGLQEEWIRLGLARDVRFASVCSNTFKKNCSACPILSFFNKPQQHTRIAEPLTQKLQAPRARRQCNKSGIKGQEVDICVHPEGGCS